MKIDWKERLENPYLLVENIIDKWCEYNNYYSDMIVLLKIDGIEEKCVLECDSFGGWEWDYDWFEGGEIELLGFCPVDKVIIPDEYMIK